MSDRRIFRSRRKINKAGLVSHITQHAAGRDPLFVETDDRLYFLSLCKDLWKEHGIDFLAFCLMTNHVHLLLKQTEDNLPATMQNLFHRYACYFNGRYGRRGHLFNSPFRQSVCLDPLYLLSVSLYIHLNPVRVGLANSYSGYRWSSWRLYCGPGLPKSFVDPQPILRMLGKDLSARQACYRRYLKKALRRGGEMKLREAAGRFGIRLWLEQAAGSITILLQSPAAGEDDLRLSSENLEAALRRITERGGMKSLRDPASRLFVVEQLQARGYRRDEIAEALGITERTIYRLSKQVCH